MDSRIDELLERYWIAETSIEEERELKELISVSDLEEYEEIKVLLGYYEDESKVVLDGDFDEELLQLIEDQSETKVIKMNTLFRKYSSIAAAVLVLFMSSLMFMKDQESLTSEDTFESPEEAYVELKKQLLMVSNYMNKGNPAIHELSSLGSANNELAAFGKMSNASSGLELLGEMNRIN